MWNITKFFKIHQNKRKWSSSSFVEQFSIYKETVRFVEPIDKMQDTIWTVLNWMVPTQSSKIHQNKGNWSSSSFVEQLSIYNQSTTFDNPSWPIQMSSQNCKDTISV